MVITAVRDARWSPLRAGEVSMRVLASEWSPCASDRARMPCDWTATARSGMEKNISRGASTGVGGGKRGAGDSSSGRMRLRDIIVGAGDGAGRARAGNRL